MKQLFVNNDPLAVNGVGWVAVWKGIIFGGCHVYLLVMVLTPQACKEIGGNIFYSKHKVKKNKYRKLTLDYS
jgi:hypothetical protein